MIKNSKEYYEKIIKSKLLNDNEFIKIEPNKNGSFSHGWLTYRHTLCGKISKINISHIIYNDKPSIHCTYCYGKKNKSKEEVFINKAKIMRKDFNDYEFLEKIKNSKEPIKIKHKKCGHVFYCRINDFLHNNAKCPLCSHHIPYNTKDALNSLIQSKDNEYEIIKVYPNAQGNFSTKSKAMFKHKKCQSTFIIQINNFLYNNRRCPICTKKKLKENLKKLNKVHSKKSDFIEDILKKINISYTREKTFNWLKYKRNMYLDFYFEINNKKYAIEYDGKEHFIFNKSSTLFDKECVELTKKRDAQKTELCKEHDIFLIRFNYLQTNKEIKEKIQKLFSSETIENTSKDGSE